MRQIHLDFHTSEHIPDVGSAFNPGEFAARLASSHVNSVTLFARCHHGWCYYPTRVGKPHPHLKRENLLGEMIKACREKDIDTPVYLTVQWDERIAREHPEWRVMNAYNISPHSPGLEPSAMNQLTPTWHTLCLSHIEYQDYLIALGKELVDLYNIDGLFLDIVSSHECVCPECLSSMAEEGLDALNPAHRKQHDRNVNLRFTERFTTELQALKPAIRIFYNSGHVFKGDRERYQFYSHFELESLPTGGWGYDHFPLSARYVDTLGKDMLGMTGKFHTHWGEFGGFKRPEALEYECCHMVSLGAACSIGDQLHPSGELDELTYSIVEPAYRRIEKLEPYLKGSRYLSEIAVLSAEAASKGAAGSFLDVSYADAGAARMLLELHYPFDMIDSLADFSPYRVLVLPDNIKLNNELASKVKQFLSHGGKIIHSGSSGMDAEEECFMFDTGLQYSGKKGEWNPEYLRLDAEWGKAVAGAVSPDSALVMYGSPRIVRAGKGHDVLAQCYPPYFNRSWNRFCSHMHAPADVQAQPHGDGIIRTEYGYYFAHEIFSQYYSQGQPLLKYMVREALRALLDTPLLKVNLLSAGRASVLFQEKKNRYLVNLLYAPTQLRGSSYGTLQGNNEKIEIIEDVPEIRDVSAELRVTSQPARVYNAYTEEELEWTYSEGYVRWTVPVMHIHAAAVIQM